MSVIADLATIQRRIDAIAGSSVPVPLGSSAFERMVRREAASAGVDPSLVAAVARTESGLDPRATSPAGAAGLMQLMPATAQALGVADPYDPVANIRGGAIYLRELLARFGGDIALAVAAYNAGPGAVERFGGVPPYAETRRYVARVMEAYRAELGR
jgi:soluble lytic murein transglycosylase-like protein